VRPISYWRSKTVNGKTLFEFCRAPSRHWRRGTHSRSAVRRPEPSERRLFRRRAYHLKLLQPATRRSKIDRDSDFTPSPLAQQQRILTRALGCGVEELVAQLGTKTAIKRFEGESRRAKRARSRKLYAFWSAVLVRIETETDEPRNTKPARSAHGGVGS
jgi:hypothetical protein